MVGVYITNPDVDLNMKPTQKTYDDFQHAFEHFNYHLFDSQLPNCLITLQRKGRRNYGYFCDKRFVRLDGNHCDEIALNPVQFNIRSLEDTLSTLVHEMVHLWQAHFGKPGRGRYHNRQWAEKMKSIDLYPSNTGAPGGKELGDQMTHYAIEGGLFIKAATSLIEDGFKIEWQDRRKLKAGITTGPKAPKVSKAGKRVKYSCPACGLNAWSKHDARFRCDTHDILLTAQ